MSSGEDRISLLSDDLLRHILSFVDPCTRFHARTSVLSKRWRHLWAHHPNLHLSVPEPPTEKSNKEIKSIRRSYVRSVHRCLKSFDPASLHSFTVCLFHFHYAAGHRWLRFAALKSVKDLTVLGRFATRRGRDGGFCLIPRSLFLCQDITNLAIHSGKLQNVPRSFQGFRGLKNLSFVRVHVSNKTLADLLDSCPLLECLTLDECEGLTCLKIDSKNLARLFLDTTYMEMELSIEAPNLEAIHLEGDLIELDWKGSSVLLSEASLLVYALDEQWIRLACAVSNVSVLNTNSCFFQFGDPKGFSEEPLFENLKELNCDFDWFTSYMLIGLTNCLGECPQLEKLLVNLSYEMRSIAIGRANVLGYGESADGLLKYVDNVHEREIGNPTNHLGALGYSLDYLRTVTVKGFIGSKNEMRLAQFLLGKASVLEKFIIHDFLKREEMELQEVFANVLRASPHVQMIFNN